MTNKRTKDLVEKSRRQVAEHRAATKGGTVEADPVRNSIDVDMTTGGQLAVNNPASASTKIQASTTAETVGYASDRDYLETQLTSLDAKFEKAKTAFTKAQTTFDLILDPDVTMAQLQASIGTMDRATLDAAKVTAEGIKNAIAHQELETDIKRRANKAEENRMMFMLETIESQIAIARKANKVAGDQDSLEHEIEIRELKAETNTLREEDKRNYNAGLRERNKQLSIIRESYNAVWANKASEAAYKARASTNWANQYSDTVDAATVD